MPTYLSERSNCGQPKRGNAAKGGDRGYDAAKRTKGRKRHIVVDVWFWCKLEKLALWR
jgi:hypothetical protein